MCIGSCLAPVLSDIFLAHHDRVLSERLNDFNGSKVFRFVDDYLVFLPHDVSHFPSVVNSLLTVFSTVLDPLKLTHEVPVDNVIQFLDIRLTLSEQHVCWKYQPRANKPLLPFNSSHSKLVKRGIVNLCFVNAIRRSCHHAMPSGLKEQSERLVAAGFPGTLLVSVAEKVLKKLRVVASPDQDVAQKKQRVAVVPYMHKTAHDLKRIANRLNARVVFSAPEKLAKLCQNDGPLPQTTGWLREEASQPICRLRRRRRL